MNDFVNLFMRNGYARAPERVPEELLAPLDDRVKNLFAMPTPPYRINDAGQVSRVDSLIERDPAFLNVLRTPYLLDLLRPLLGPDIEIVLHRHNHATLNRAGDIPFRLHRDVQQWTRPLLDVFIYLEDTGLGNGCTHIVPGSHLLPCAGPQSDGGAGTWADEHDQFRHLIGQELPVPMQRGGILLLNALTFHSVGINKGAGSRRSMVFACRSCDDLEHPDGVSAAVLSGERRFRGSPSLRVSGSLRLPDGDHRSSAEGSF